MAKPQIILNAGAAAIAMAVAYRLTCRMIDSVLPKKRVEEEEPADEPAMILCAMYLLQKCVNRRPRRGAAVAGPGAGPRVPPLLPSSWAARGRS